MPKLSFETSGRTKYIKSTVANADFKFRRRWSLPLVNNLMNHKEGLIALCTKLH